MGIDIYAEWPDQTEVEEAAQITGYSIEHGSVGYLREAYHGAPYVTKYLVAEAFNSATGEAEIHASVLRERLPAAVLMSMYREHKVYGQGDPAALKLDAGSDASALLKCIVGIFENEVPDMSHLAFVETLTDESLETAKNLIASGVLPSVQKSFVDFVELCERKEAATGEPCRIIASY
jgi:hypothetical protein